MDLDPLITKKENIYIIEGPNSYGRTTFAKKLSAYNSIRYFQNEAVPNNYKEFEYYSKKEIDTLNEYKNIVLDRSFIISEYVYSRFFNRDIFCFKNDLEILEKSIINKKINLVFCFLEKPITINIDDYEDKMSYMDKLTEHYKKLINEFRVNYFVKYMQ